MREMRNLARVDVDIRGLKRLWGRRFTILSAHSFDAESVSMLRAVLFESAAPLHVGLRFEEVPRTRPE
jgi:hypothetical protein